MTWWILLYLVLYALLAAAGIWDDHRDRRPAWFLAAALCSNIVIITLFAAYWYPGPRMILGRAAIPLFLAAIGWEIHQAIVDIRAVRDDPELPKRRRRFLAILTILLLTLLCLPAYVVAGLAAFRV